MPVSAPISGSFSGGSAAFQLARQAASVPRQSQALQLPSSEGSFSLCMEAELPKLSLSCSGRHRRPSFHLIGPLSIRHTMLQTVKNAERQGGAPVNTAARIDEGPGRLALGFVNCCGHVQKYAEAVRCESCI